jgi:hypothetical protein
MPDLVFLDEMGANISLFRLYGWAKKGEGAHCSVPRNRGKNTTLLSSLSMEEMGTAISALGAEDARRFLEHCGYRAMVQTF